MTTTPTTQEAALARPALAAPRCRPAAALLPALRFLAAWLLLDVALVLAWARRAL